MPIDPRRTLTRPEYQAHLAIISGKKTAREKQNQDMQNEAP